MKTKLKWSILLLIVLITQISFAQQRMVSGTVSDASGLPLPAVSVTVKGTTGGTQTDMDGNFQISASPADILVFEFVGMLTKELPATTISMSVTLSENATDLETVVITAMGIRRKPDEITTASQVVRSSELNQAKAPNAVIGLTGKVSGLQINTLGHGVNPENTIQLRGFRSLTGNNEALVVINGVISTAGALSELNPEIIESVNVLKGASGAALYGSLGSNGVLIVTTKKGTRDAEKMTVSINSSYVMDEVAYLPKLQNRYGQGYQGAQDFVENTSWGAELDGSLQPTGLDQILMPYSFIKDNYKGFFNTGNTALNSVAVSAGDQNGYVNLSIGNQMTNGTIPTETFKKNNFYFSAGKTAGKWTVDANMRYTTSTENTAGGVQGSINNSLYQVPVNVPVEAFSHGMNESHWTYWELSPYWRLKNERIMSKGQTFEGVGEVGYKFNDNISAIYRAGFRSTSFNGYQYFNGYTAPVIYWGSPVDEVSEYGVNNSNTRRIYADLIVNFDYMLTDDISFKANVGNNVTNWEGNILEMTGQRLVVPGIYNIGNITGNVTNPIDTKTQERAYAFFANLDFGYKDWLFLNLTARNEWTSVLAKGNNSYFYPSAGISFIPTKAFDDFGGEFLTYAKISANIVEVGNKVIGPYDINDRFLTGATAGFPYLSGNSFVQSLNITDANLKPESNLSKEVNLNLEFFNRRITLDGSYYHSSNTNQILGISPSTTSGANTATVNIGETTSTGFELDLGVTPFKSEDFTWDMKLGYSVPKTTVDRVSPTASSVTVGNPIGTLGITAIEGERFPMLVGTGYERDDQGNVVIDAATGDPLKATNVKLGRTTPDYILNFSTNFRYKNWTLSSVFDYRTGHVFWAGVKDGLVQNGTDIVTAENGRQPFIFPGSVIDDGNGGFTENTNITTSGGQDYYTGIYREIDENFIVDATAFKCREIALSYTFGEKMLQNTFISSLSVGFNARNVFMILPKENRNYSDPEFSTFSRIPGINTGNEAPPTRTYGFNVNITF